MLLVMRNTSHAALILATVIALAGCSENMIHPPKPEVIPPPPLPKTKAIYGRATITLKGLDLQYKNRTEGLEGLEIALCNSDAGEKVKEVRDKTWMENAKNFDFSEAAGYRNLELDAIGLTAVKNAVKLPSSEKPVTAKAGRGGYFIIPAEDLPAGKYYLYAQYVSRYAKAYWLVPVEVSDEALHIEANLNNDSAKEIYNKPLK